LVGAIDGSLFLGIFGTAVGLIGARGHVAWTTLGHAAFSVLLLIAAAVFFGCLALGIIYAGGRAVAGVFAGGMLGAASGAFIGRADGLVIGALGGVLAGTVLGVVSRGRR
jgi:outer membrane lipoprotein SlyB